MRRWITRKIRMSLNIMNVTSAFNSSTLMLSSVILGLFLSRAVKSPPDALQGIDYRCYKHPSKHSRSLRKLRFALINTALFLFNS